MKPQQESKPFPEFHIEFCLDRNLNSKQVTIEFDRVWRRWEHEANMGRIRQMPNIIQQVLA